MDYSPPGSSVPGILQTRILEWVAMPSSWGSLQPKDQICISYVSRIGRQVLSSSTTWEAPGPSTNPILKVKNLSSLSLRNVSDHTAVKGWS